MSSRGAVVVSGLQKQAECFFSRLVGVCAVLSNRRQKRKKRKEKAKRRED